MESILSGDLIAGCGEVLTVPRETTVLQAAVLMASRHVGSLLVASDAGAATEGILTERDVLVKVIAGGRDPSATTVGEVMSEQLICCRPDQSIADAQNLMIQHNIRHLPVMQNGRVIGILSSRDILLHQLASVQGLGQSLLRLVEQFRNVFPTVAAGG